MPASEPEIRIQPSILCRERLPGDSGKARRLQGDSGVAPRLQETPGCGQKRLAETRERPETPGRVRGGPETPGDSGTLTTQKDSQETRECPETPGESGLSGDSQRLRCEAKLERLQETRERPETPRRLRAAQAARRLPGHFWIRPRKRLQGHSAELPETPRTLFPRISGKTPWRLGTSQDSRETPE